VTLLVDQVLGGPVLVRVVVPRLVTVVLDDRIVMPSRFTAARTLDATCSNANSGVCTPTITRPFLWYVVYHDFRCGSVRRQLMHEYVQKSTSTTLPRSCASVNGFELIQSPSGCSGGATP
jgi:hypothetical protein